MTSRLEKALSIERRRFGGEGLCRRVPFARHRALFDGALFDRPHRLAGLAIEDEHPALLGWLRDRLDRFAVDGDVHQDRRARDVVVPDAVMHELVVPDALAGLQIDGDEAFAEQIVAGTMSAEIVAGWNFNGQVGDAELLVDGDLRPHAGVAGVGPRIFQPGVVAELTGPRDGVKRPEAFPGARVVAAHVPFRVGLAARRRSGAVRGADDDDVLGDDRRAVPRDFAGDRIELLIGVLLEIDDAVDAEILERLAGLGVEADELIADRDVEDPLVSSCRRSSSRRRVPTTGAPRLRRAGLPRADASKAVRRCGVDGDRVAMLAGGGVEHAVDHQRRGLQIEVGTLAEVLGLEAPGDFERVEVGGVDLIERRVAGDPEIAAPRAPLAVGRAALRRDGCRGGEQQQRDE